MMSEKCRVAAKCLICGAIEGRQRCVCSPPAFTSSAPELDLGGNYPSAAAGLDCAVCGGRDPSHFAILPPVPHEL